MADSSEIRKDDIFVGRDEELSLLRRVMDHEGIRYLYLTGRYGVGKKTLAFEYVKRHSDEYDVIIKISAKPLNIMVKHRDGEEFNFSDIVDERYIIRRYCDYLQMLSEKSKKWIVIIYNYTYIPGYHEPNIRELICNNQIPYKPDVQSGYFSGGGSGSFIIIPSLDYSIKDIILLYRYGGYCENSAFHVEPKEINTDYYQTDERDRSHELTFLYRLKDLTPEYASELLLKTSGSDDISASEKLVTDDYIGCLPLMIERTGEYVVYNRMTLDDVITEIDSKNFPLFKMTQLKTIYQFVDEYGLEDYSDIIEELGFFTLEDFKYLEIEDLRGNDIVYHSANKEIIRYQDDKLNNLADQIIQTERYDTGVDYKDIFNWKILVALSVSGSSFTFDDFTKRHVSTLVKMIEMSLLEIIDGSIRVYPLIQNIVNTSLSEYELERVPSTMKLLGLKEVSVKSSSKR